MDYSAHVSSNSISKSLHCFVCVARKSETIHIQRMILFLSVIYLSITNSRFAVSKLLYQLSQCAYQHCEKFSETGLVWLMSKLYCLNTYILSLPNRTCNCLDSLDCWFLVVHLLFIIMGLGLTDLCDCRTCGAVQTMSDIVESFRASNAEGGLWSLREAAVFPWTCSSRHSPSETTTRESLHADGKLTIDWLTSCGS